MTSTASKRIIGRQQQNESSGAFVLLSILCMLRVLQVSRQMFPWCQQNKSVETKPESLTAYHTYTVSSWNTESPVSGYEPIARGLKSFDSKFMHHCVAPCKHKFILTRSHYSRIKRTTQLCHWMVGNCKREAAECGDVCVGGLHFFNKQC